MATKKEQAIRIEELEASKSGLIESVKRCDSIIDELREDLASRVDELKNATERAESLKRAYDMLKASDDKMIDRLRGAREVAEDAEDQLEKKTRYIEREASEHSKTLVRLIKQKALSIAACAVIAQQDN